MAALGGGLVALLLGIIGIIFWFGYFIKALQAGLPAMLILGGALAVYLGFEELKDKKTHRIPLMTAQLFSRARSSLLRTKSNR